MTTFDSVPFMVLGDQPISLQQTLGYLQLSGKLRSLLRDIVSQHIVLQEIQTRSDLPVSADEVKQAVLNFCLQRNLTDGTQIQEWLKRQGINFETFRTQVAYSLKLQKLRTAIAAPHLQTYFDANQESLDQIMLLGLVVTDQSLAQEISNHLQTGEISFEQVAKNYTTAEGSKVNFTNGLVRRGALPTMVRQALDTASLGEIIGPFALSNCWGLFRVEQVLPAVLDNQLKLQIENQLFLKWLAEKINPLTLQFASGQTDRGDSKQDLKTTQDRVVVGAASL